MAKTRITKGRKKNAGILSLKIVMERLLSGKKYSSDDDENDLDKIRVPSDVKEGHFAVIAVDDDKFRRFVVPLSFLTHPSFLRLLEQAAEEYGFDHNGALTVPCRPTVFEQILAEQTASRVHNWSSYNETTVASNC